MNIIQEFDTITAIATPIGTGGVGVIRISGDKSFDILDRIYSKHNLEIGKISHGWILDGDKKIDEVIILPFKNPNSYTGEDVIEIHCHGGVNVVRNILDVVLRNGARMAERGEFTKRAFLNKKMDLSQAEAVADLIHAKTRDFAKQSAKNLSGVLSEKIKEIREDIFQVLSKIVAGIDFPEDVKEPEYDYLITEFEKAIEEIDKVLAGANSSNIMRQGIKIAIVGKPNVGKSSLFNTLLNVERAIVTDIAGTTRDVLKETLDWDIAITLIDTAGIRDGEEVGKVEEIGIEYSKQSVDEADLVLFLYDASQGLNEDDMAILDLVKDKKCIVIGNKADLISEEQRAGRQEGRLFNAAKQLSSQAAKLDNDEISQKQQTDMVLLPNRPIVLSPDEILLSTITKQGLDELKSKIKEIAYNFSLEDMEFVTNNRQQDCLIKCRESLSLALEASKNYELQDLISIDVKSALLYLDEITGEVITDDILNNIFDHFCIGK
ncbi:tRNA uridine-5-carboxymethylaminomethyl(34) synthesis GTPase MnmE [bacterium]|nr:tRNA uridine-5-carboxymethylaminomethyl(34) synthesis GTPase MnmE [bacterium]